jgi:hypothetical protein
MKIDHWLEDLKVPRDAYRVVTLLPLVHVAWADGKVQKAEHDLILRIAEQQGLLENGGRAVLEHWLTVRPTAAQLKNDLAILNELGRSSAAMAQDFGADEMQLLVAWCQDVADAAGGLLGLRSARREQERAALKQIATALEIHTATRWRSTLGW